MVGLRRICMLEYLTLSEVVAVCERMEVQCVRVGMHYLHESEPLNRSCVAVGSMM